MTLIHHNSGSIQHYPAVSFAIENTVSTIKPLKGEPTIGNRRDFSLVFLFNFFFKCISCSAGILKLCRHL